jgi:hypothetical protein
MEDGNNTIENNVGVQEEQEVIANVSENDGQITQNTQEESAVSTDEQENSKEVRTFTQEELNKIVEDRIARERRVAEERSKSDPARSLVERYAREAGMDVSSYLEALEKQEQEEKIQREAQKRNLDPETMRYLNQLEREREEARQKLESETKRQAQYREFFETFPDAKVEDIHPETLEKFHSGIPLKYAYMEQKYSEALSEVEKYKLGSESQKANEEAKATSPGSVSQSGTPKQTYFSPEQVRNMSREEIRKNLKDIERSQKQWSKE